MVENPRNSDHGFKELYMIFLKDSHTHTLKRIQPSPPKIISSQHMEKLLKKRHSSIIAQFHAIQGLDTTPLEPHPDMQQVLANYSHVFELPKVLPSTRGDHNHSIPLLFGSQPLNVHPYRYPFAQKNEIKKIIQELLVASIIQPSTSPYSPIVMVFKKEGD